MTSESYTLAQAAAFTGFKKPWMVDYLCRTGVVVPSKRRSSGRGSPRLFSFSDLVVLRAMRELLRSGVSAKRLSLEVRRYRKTFAEISHDSVPYRYLVTDGTRLHFEKGDSPKPIEESGQSCIRLLVDLRKAHREVTEAIAARPHVPPVNSFRRPRAPIIPG